MDIRLVLCLIVAVFQSDAIDVSSKLDFDTEGVAPSNLSRLTSGNATGYDSTLSTGVVNAYINLQQNIDTARRPNRTDTLAEELVGSGNPGPSKLVDSNLCINGRCVVATRRNDDKLLTDVRVTVVANVDGQRKDATMTTGRPKDVPVFVGTTGNGRKNNFVPIYNELGADRDVPVFVSNDGRRPSPRPDGYGTRRPYGPGGQTLSAGPYGYGYDKGNTYTEFQLPHFDRTYHTHHFGESPPPSSVWIGSDVATDPNRFLHERRPNGGRGRHHQTPKYYYYADGSAARGSNPHVPCVCQPIDDVQYQASTRVDVNRRSDNLRVDDKIDQI